MGTESPGFIITLSSYIPDLIEQDIAALVEEATHHSGLSIKDITHWCIHPGGKKILAAIKNQLRLSDEDMRFSKSILSRYGNMSSPTVLFVLKEILDSLDDAPGKYFRNCFRPRLNYGNIFMHQAIDLRYRSYTKELLDKDDIPFEDIRLNMHELNTINTWLGGHSITLAGVKKLLKARKQINVCEIGCGDGNNLYQLYNGVKKKAYNSGAPGSISSPNVLRVPKKIIP
jgi:hypothetical protein